MLRISTLSLSLAVAFAGVSHAAVKFTFTGTGHDAGGAWVKLDGQNIGATASTVESVAVGVDGKRQAANGHCQSWTPDATSGYALETVCNYSTSDGTYATISWCPKDMSTQGCSGKLVGVSGAYANRMGSFIVLTKPGRGDTDDYSGSGEWD